jgi:hypothetical protein
MWRSPASVAILAAALNAEGRIAAPASARRIQRASCCWRWRRSRALAVSQAPASARLLA